MAWNKSHIRQACTMSLPGEQTPPSDNGYLCDGGSYRLSQFGR
jgi:hypothetical protein